MGRRWGFHSGKLTANQITVNDTLTVNGNISFGDASTDTLTVTGLSTFSAAVDINSTVDVAHTGTSTTDALAVHVADGGTGSVISLDHNETNGNAVGLGMNVASTGASAFAFDITGIATNSGIIQTNSVTTDMAIDNAAGVIRIQYNDGSGAATGYIPIISTFT